jgi:hypothetical protein
MNQFVIAEWVAAETADADGGTSSGKRAQRQRK